MSRRLNATVALVAVIGFAPPVIAQGSGWRWNVTPYMWGANTGLDVELDDRELVDATVPLDTIIDRLDFAFMINVQGQRGRNGLFVDLATYDFNDDPVTVPLPEGLNVLVASGDLGMTQLDLAGLYNPSGDGLGFTLIYGVRMLDVDQTLDAYLDTPVGPTETERYAAAETFWDGLLAFRYLAHVSESWLFDIKADVSTGSTELTWSAVAGLGYSFGSRDQYSVFGGYRYMEYDFEQDASAVARITSQLTLDGFFAAFRFGF